MLKILAIAVACALPVASFAETPTASKGALVDEHGMTLYTFDKDTAGKSACSGACTSLWPAAAADSYDKASGDWSIIASGAGGHQWAYRGHPLYRYSHDKSAGDMTGDNFKNVWHVAKP